MVRPVEILVVLPRPRTAGAGAEGGDAAAVAAVAERQASLARWRSTVSSLGNAAACSPPLPGEEDEENVDGGLDEATDTHATFHAVPSILLFSRPGLLARLSNGGSAVPALPRLGRRPAGKAWRWWGGKAGAALLADPPSAAAAAASAAADAYAAVRVALGGRAVLCPPPPELLAGGGGGDALLAPALWEHAWVAGDETIPAAAPPPPPPTARGSPRRGAPPPPPRPPPPGVDLPPALASVVAGVLPLSSLARDQADAFDELHAVVSTSAWVVHWAGKGWGLGVQKPGVASV